MRTSLNNIKAIEDYLFGRLATGDALLFEAHLLLNSDLPDDMRHQQNTYTMVQQYSRRQLKAEIIVVQQKLAAESKYQPFLQRIINLFKK